MESSHSLKVMCNTKKRKKPTSEGQVKKLKIELEGEEMDQCGSSASSPRVSVPSSLLQQPVTLTDVMELLHFAALGETGGMKQPSWCQLSYQKKVTGINVVIVEGLTQSLFYKNYLSMKHLRTHYSTRITLAPSPDSMTSKIFSSEIPKVEKFSAPRQEEKKNMAVKHHPVVTTFGTQKKGLTAYALTQEAMIKNHFPVKGLDNFEDFVCTDTVDYVTDSSPLYGLDCEMCLTEKGNELTRVSLVDSTGNCVMDELVKPQKPVLNYLTKFSGITAAMLRPVTTTLAEARNKLRKLLPADAVLVGHSLDNDLLALKLIHPFVVDTSLLYKREFGQKFKLKVLAEIVLNKKIQTEEKKGHNPFEDAVTALELAQYFIKKGPQEVVRLHLEDLWGYKFEEESSDCATVPEPSYRFTDVLQTCGLSTAFLGRRADVTLDLSNQQWYRSDKEMLTAFRRQTKHPFLAILQFSSLSDHLKKCFSDQQLLYPHVHGALQDMCIVFAGPFPAGFSEKKVRRLFSICGEVRRVRMLNTSFTVHAEVEYKLLEGAVLALKILNGLSIEGQPIKVQRPMNESMLDLDLLLDTLMCDTVNADHLYTVKLSPKMAQNINISSKVNGQSLNGVRMKNELSHAEMKDEQTGLVESAPALTEKAVRSSFSQFGAVRSVTLPTAAEKYARYAHIEFQSAESKHAAASSSDVVLRDNYLVCPSLTPLHLTSWVTTTTPMAENGEAAETEGGARDHCSSQLTATNVLYLKDQKMDQILKKLDCRVARVFRCLPVGTLSVVILHRPNNLDGEDPGLCLLQVKTETSEGI